jgi:hypothetical protein
MSHKKFNKSTAINWRVSFLVNRNQRTHYGLGTISNFDNLAVTCIFEMPADLIVGQ